MVDEDTILKRDSERPLDCQMKERCVVLLNEFENENFNKNNILHTDNLNINECVNQIILDDRFIIK